VYYSKLFNCDRLPTLTLHGSYSFVIKMIIGSGLFRRSNVYVTVGRCASTMHFVTCSLVWLYKLAILETTDTNHEAQIQAS